MAWRREVYCSLLNYCRSSRRRCTLQLDSATRTTWCCCCNMEHLRTPPPRTSTRPFTSPARKDMRMWSRCCLITERTNFLPPRYTYFLMTVVNSRLKLTCFASLIMGKGVPWPWWAYCTHIYIPAGSEYGIEKESQKIEGRWEAGKTEGMAGGEEEGMKVRAFHSPSWGVYCTPQTL